MKLLDYYYRLRLGLPKRGNITHHARFSYPYEEGTETRSRIESVWGAATLLTAADLGCGACSTTVGGNVFGIPWKRLISVEVFGPYVARLRAKKAAATDHAIIEDRIENFFNRVQPHEIDLILLIDVIEHFRRRDALALIARLERWARRGIVIFSPLGKVEQEAFDENPLQKHLSFWRAEDLANLGYDVTVYYGLHGQLDPPADAAWAIKVLSGGKA